MVPKVDFSIHQFLVIPIVILRLAPKTISKSQGRITLPTLR